MIALFIIVALAIVVACVLASHQLLGTRMDNAYATLRTDLLAELGRIKGAAPGAPAAAAPPPAATPAAPPAANKT